MKKHLSNGAISIFAHAKHVVGESESCSNDIFESLSTRFAENSTAELKGSEIQCQFVL